MSHLTCKQRYALELMIVEGISKSIIALRLKVHKSTILRGLKRNSDKRNGEYRFQLAQQKYDKRLVEKPKSLKFEGKLKEEVENLLREDYSPEQISGVLKKQGKEKISHERIYQYV